MSLISVIVSEKDYGSHQEYYKARFLVILAGVFLVLGMLYGTVYTRVYDYTAGGLVLYSTSVVNLFNIFLLYRFRSVKLSGNISCLLLFAALFVISYSSGGINAHSNVWFAALVILAFMVVGSGSGFFWSGVLIASFFVMFQLEAGGHQFPEFMDNGTNTLRNFITFTGAMTTIMLLAYFFQRIGDRAFNLIDETLNTTVRKLERTRDQMLESAQYTNDQAQHVKSYTNEVSENLNEVNRDIQQVNDSIRQVEQNVSQADQISDQANRITGEAQSRITNLKQRSEEIGKVVEVINTVATQVNLLALNASVESVRAGEAGAGFGIVADEIKSLANKTAENTGQIEATIKAVQQDIGSIVDQIASINEVIKEVNTKQKDISGAVDQQAKTTSNMVERVTESARGGDEINKLVQDLANLAESLIGEVAKRDGYK